MMTQRHGLVGIVLMVLLGQFPVEAKPIAYANPQQLAQVAETTITGRLDGRSRTLSDGSYYNSHSFEGVAGETILIEMVSPAFDVYLILLSPDGAEIA
ncbi:MAG: hypothetical protein F6K42_30255, partial [Leptolyngbya sp. SIO1D8]|nr:hypothetical protein [Leptolyngbya sp. SIO1D8]